MKKGKLVNIELSPGRFVKMYEQDAIKQGLLIKAKPKTKAPEGDKMQRPGGDKQAAPPDKEPEPTPEDDFTSIEGIGPATARLLQARSITTFEELRQAGDLHFLSATVQKSVEKWRDNG